MLAKRDILREKAVAADDVEKVDCCDDNML
jgi:hypothetical protein